MAEDNIELTAAFVNNLNYLKQNNNSKKSDENNQKNKKKSSEQQRLIPFSIHLVYNCEYLIICTLESRVRKKHFVKPKLCI